MSDKFYKFLARAVVIELINRFGEKMTLYQVLENIEGAIKHG
jgi:hypothetical protein